MALRPASFSISRVESSSERQRQRRNADGNAKSWRAPILLSTTPMPNPMAKKRKAKKAKTKRKRTAIPQALTPHDIFEGIKGRRPKSDKELNDWLASPEGKAAMRPELSLDRWGETI